MNKFIHIIDVVSERSGKLLSWLVLLLVLVVVYDVGMRYIFHIGSVALQELEWHLFAVLFMLGAAYTLKHDAHVRVDMLYRSGWMNDYRRAWVDLFGTLFMLLPFSVLIIFSSWDFVVNSFLISEGSPDPGGLPYRFILKATIPLGFILLIFQGIAQSLRAINIIAAKHTSHQSKSLTGN